MKPQLGPGAAVCACLGERSLARWLTWSEWYEDRTSARVQTKPKRPGLSVGSSGRARCGGAALLFWICLRRGRPGCDSSGWFTPQSLHSAAKETSMGQSPSCATQGNTGPGPRVNWRKEQATTSVSPSTLGRRFSERLYTADGSALSSHWPQAPSNSQGPGVRRTCESLPVCAFLNWAQERQPAGRAHAGSNCAGSQRDRP